MVVQGAFSNKYQKHMAVKKTTSSNINNLDRLESKLLQEPARKCKKIVKLYGMFAKQVSDNEFTFELIMEKANMSLEKEIKDWFQLPREERLSRTMEREKVHWN